MLQFSRIGRNIQPSAAIFLKRYQTVYGIFSYTTAASGLKCPLCHATLPLRSSAAQRESVAESWRYHRTRLHSSRLGRDQIPCWGYWGYAALGVDLPQIAAEFVSISLTIAHSAQISCHFTRRTAWASELGHLHPRFGNGNLFYLLLTPSLPST